MAYRYGFIIYHSGYANGISLQHSTKAKGISEQIRLLTNMRIAYQRMESKVDKTNMPKNHLLPTIYIK